MELLKAPKELLKELKQQQVIDILPMNWSVICWFIDVCDLMNYRADGACLGLDLLQIESEASLCERQFSKAEFQGLRVMSKTVAKVVNKVD